MINRPVPAIRGKAGGIGKLLLSTGTGRGLDFSGFNPIPFNAQDFFGKILKHIQEVTKKNLEFQRIWIQQRS
jgi:hypothetical protein